MRPLAILAATADAATTRREVGAALGGFLAAATSDPSRMLPLWTAFSRGEPVRASDLARSTEQGLVERLLNLQGLVEVDVEPGELWVRADLCIVPVALAGGMLWVASDFPWWSDEPDCVGGPGAATETLRALVPDRWAATSVLDLGSGSGALGLSFDAARLTAVDLNPRATAYTELTAALNGQAVDAVVGDFTDAVTGPYELVVCNPPFVLGRPDGRTVFRDADDERAHAALAHDILPVLAPGGLGAYLTNWVYGPGLPDPLAALADDLATLPASDVLVLERAQVTAPDYVRVWTDDAALADAWSSGLQDAGVTHVGTGAVVVRRLSDADDDEPAAVTVARPYDPPLEDLAGLVDTWLAAQDAARGVRDDGLLVAAAYEVLDDGTGMTVRTPDGLRLAVNGPADQIDNLVLPLLAALRQPDSAGAAIRAVPLLRSTPGAARDLVRTLVRTGLVMPA